MADSSSSSGARWLWPALVLCALVGAYFWVRRQNAVPETLPPPIVPAAEQAARDARRFRHIYRYLHSALPERR